MLEDNKDRRLNGHYECTLRLGGINDTLGAIKLELADLRAALGPEPKVTITYAVGLGQGGSTLAGAPEPPDQDPRDRATDLFEELLQQLAVVARDDSGGKSVSAVIDGMHASLEGFKDACEHDYITESLQKRADAHRERGISAWLAKRWG